LKKSKLVVKKDIFKVLPFFFFFFNNTYCNKKLEEV